MANQQEEMYTYFSNIYNELDEIVVQAEENDEDADVLVEEFLTKKGLPNSFERDFLVVDNAMMADEDNTTQLLQNFFANYGRYYPNAVNVVPELVTEETQETVASTLEEAQEITKEKVVEEYDMSSITYDSMADLLELYRDVTKSDESQLRLEVFDMVEKLGKFENETLLNKLLEQNWDGTPRFKKFIIMQYKDLSKSRGRVASNDVTTGTEQDKKDLLTLLIKAFSYITWNRVEFVVNQGKLNLSEEEIALLPIAPEEAFVTPFARTIPNVKVENDYVKILAMCKAFLENRRDLFERVRTQENRMEQLRKESELQDKAINAFNTDYSNEAINSEINSIINSIMTKYEKILAPIFINKPEGVLTPDGVLQFNKEKMRLEIKPVFANYAKRVFEQISNVWTYNKQGSLNFVESNIYSFDYDIDVFDSNLKLKTTYIPSFFVMLIEGISIHNTEGASQQLKIEYNFDRYKTHIREMLEAYIKKISYTVIEKTSNEMDVLDILSEIKDGLNTLFLNVIYCDKFDMDTTIGITFSINYDYFDGRSDLSSVMRVLENSMGAELKIPKGQGSLVNSNVTDSIGKFLYATNWGNYTGDTLFSYEAIENQAKAGYQPSMSGIIIGRKLSGEDVKLNFADNSNILFSIMAGSRSGKGVQTLNILLTALGIGTPIAYADGKPDMAGIFWELEKQYNVPILAIDGAQGSTVSGQSPARPFNIGLNMPPKLKEYGFITEDFRILGYLKLMMIMTALSDAYYTNVKVSASGEEAPSIKMFIIDEINKMSTKAGNLLQKVLNCEKNLPNANSKNATDEDKATRAYITRLRKFLDTDLINALASMKNTSGGVSGVKALFIGQNVTKKSFYYGGRVTTTNPFYYALEQATIRIIGVRHGQDDSLGVSKKNPLSDSKGMEFLGLDTGNDGNSSEDPSKDPALGYFAIIYGDSTVNTGHMYKSYLTLNDNDIEKVYPAMTKDLVKSDVNDFKGSFTGGLLLRSPNANRVYQKDLTRIVNNNVVPNHLIGFIPLMEEVIKNKYGTFETGKKEFTKTLTTLYCDAYNLIRYAGYEFPNLEDFLYDCSIDTIVTADELLARLPIQKKYGEQSAKTVSYEPLTHEEVKSIVYGQRDYRFMNEPTNSTTPIDGTVYNIQDDSGNWQMTEPTGEAPQEEPPNPSINDILGGYKEPPIPVGGSTEDFEQDHENNEQYGEQPTYDQPTYDQPTFEQPPVYEEMPRQETPIQQQAFNQNQEQYNQQQPINAIPQTKPSIYNDQPDAFKQDTRRNYSQNGAVSDTVEVDMSKRRHPFASKDTINNVGGVISALKESSTTIFSEIEKIVGDFKRAKTLVLSPNGILVNGIRLQLNYPDEILQNYPTDIRLRLSKGDYLDLVHFKDVFKLKNLVQLIVEVPITSEAQVLRDLDVYNNPYRIVKKLRDLESFEFNGEDLLNPPKDYTPPSNDASSLRDKVGSFFNIGRSVTDTVMPTLPTQRIMQSNTVRSLGKGALGAGLVWGLFNVAIPVFGFYGLLAGALTAGHMLTNKKNTRGGTSVHSYDQVPKPRKGKNKNDDHEF